MGSAKLNVMMYCYQRTRVVRTPAAPEVPALATDEAPLTPADATDEAPEIPWPIPEVATEKTEPAPLVPAPMTLPTPLVMSERIWALTAEAARAAQTKEYFIVIVLVCEG